MGMRVFIGSSSERRHPLAEFIVTYLVENCPDITPIPWYEPWPGGHYTIDVLQDVMETTDASIIVLHPDDVVQSRGEEAAAPRDNLVFEAGFFMGGHGRQRTQLLLPSDPDKGHFKKPTDIDGLTIHPYVWREGEEKLERTGLPTTIGEVCRQLRALGPRPRRSEKLKPLDGLSEIETAGLVGSWPQMFTNGIRRLAEDPGTRSIDIIAAYQVGEIRRSLGKFRKRSDTILRACFSNMWDTELAEAYRRKYHDRPVERLRLTLTQSIESLVGGCEISIVAGSPPLPMITDLDDPPNATYQIFLTRQRITFSYYRFDDVAFLVPLDMKKDQNPPPLVWAVSKESSPVAFQNYLEGVDTVLAEADLVYPSLA